MLFLSRLIPVVLLTAASAFSGSIGSLSEANTDTSNLVTSDWGIPMGSYILSLDHAATGGRASISVVAPPLAIAADATNPTNNSEPPAPIFITQPNLGFLVILTADYSAYQGPEAPIVDPGRIVLVGINDQGTDGTMTLSPFGALYAGDSKVPPTVLTGDPNNSSATSGVAPTATVLNSQTGQTSPTALAGVAALTSVPEPSTTIGVPLALIGLGWLKRRSRNA